MDGNLSRREFLAGVAVAAVATAVEPALAAESVAMGGHVLPDLPYGYDALQPYIDAETMHLHHDKHHQSYVTNLNAALKGYPELAGRPVESLLSHIEALPEGIRTAVRNQGGGHANHSLFWKTMGKVGSEGVGGEPKGRIGAQITKDFGSFDGLRKSLNEAAAKQFGAGWGWVVWSGGRLKVTTTANQDTPWSVGEKPILLNDVWEHAYYLKYQNRRADYLAAWWNVVNWQVVAERFEEAVRG